MIIISGGQSGADKTGLVVARELGYATGGWAPKDYRTEYGPDLTLRDIYGLREHPSLSYAPRTVANVKMADLTVWFGFTTSPGFRCTMAAIHRYHKAYIINPNVSQLFALITETHVESTNVAGNRQSKNIDVVFQVRGVLTPVLKMLRT